MAKITGRKRKRKPQVDSHYIIYIDTCDNLVLDKAKDLVQGMVNKLAADSRVFTVVSGCGSLKYIYKKEYAENISIQLEHSGGSNSFDAIHKIVQSVENDTTALKTNLVFILISNSSDNSSDFSFSQTVKFIEQKTKLGWDFWLSGKDFAKTNFNHFIVE